MKPLFKYSLTFWALFWLPIQFSLADEAALTALVNKVVEGQENPTGYSLYVISDNASFGVTSKNEGNVNGRLTENHMFRIASVTKTFTAAAILRLVETGRLSLEAPLKQLIDKEIEELLTRDGYDTEAITLQQVLSHTAGFYDHAQSENYINALLKDPAREWTRLEQIQGAVEWGEPVGIPGAKFAYSDTGYVILGHVIERHTEKSLGMAVRHLLNLDGLGINEVLWERGDIKTVSPSQRAHQFFAGIDTYNWNPTIDVYGGGGLVATPKGMAMFFKKLFANKIFDNKHTLELMLSSDGLSKASPYRLGVFEKDYDGVWVYEHGGFWGTLAVYHPESGTAIAGAAIKQEDYYNLRDLMVEYLKQHQQ